MIKDPSYLDRTRCLMISYNLSVNDMPILILSREIEIGHSQFIKVLAWKIALMIF